MAGVTEPGSWPTLPVQKSKREDLVLLRQGIDIAVDYFNIGQRENLQRLTTAAKNWCAKYYKGYYYAPKRATGLLKTFPNLFNLEVEAHLRITRAIMKEPDHSESEGASPRELRRAERRAANSEAFPEFAEPTLASNEEIDEIVDLRPRRSPQQPKVKPDMRVDAAMLRGSGLLQQLPEFLGQLARANLETETLLATNPEAVRFELDEDAAEEEPHIEVNLFAGVAEAQRRRHARRVILPGGRPFKLPGDEETEEGEESLNKSHGDDTSDSGDESDASTSTVASLRIRERKRKAGEMTEDDGDHSPPNKIRIQYQHPTPMLEAFDLTRREVVKKVNPLANVEADPFVQLTRKRKGDDTFMREESPSSSSDESSKSPSSKKCIKIKVVNNSDSNSSRASSATTSDSSGDSSRASTPEFKIVRVYDSNASSTSSSSSGSPSSTQSSPRIKIIRRKIRSVSPIEPLAGGEHTEPTRPSASSSGTTSSPSSTSSSPRIKIVRKTPRSVSPTEPLAAVVQQEFGSSSPSSSKSPSGSPAKPSPRIKVIRRDNRSVSPTLPLAVVASEREPARPSSSSSMASITSSGSGKSTGSGIKKIKVVGKYSPKLLARR